MPVELMFSSKKFHQLKIDGAGRRIRTDDRLITNQVLYQLSYAGD